MGFVLWAVAVLCLAYDTVTIIIGERSPHITIVGAWGLLAAAAACAWTLNRAVALHTQRVLVMLDQADEPPLRLVGRNRGQGS